MESRRSTETRTWHAIAITSLSEELSLPSSIRLKGWTPWWIGWGAWKTSQRSYNHSLGRWEPRAHYPDRVKLGSNNKRSTNLLLLENVDVFTWTLTDMSSISPSVMAHQLNANPLHWPFKQKKRSFAPERQKTIDEEETNCSKHASSRRWPIQSGSWM